MSDIKPLFSQPYQRESWLDALQKNIHKIEIFSREVLVKQKLVDDFYYLGIATLSCGTKLGIYEVRTNAKTQLHRNRVQMRNLVAKQCQFNDCNGAMAVYHNDNANDNAQWRFSFISIGWELQSGKLVKTQTPTRRYTYLLGVGRNTRTVVKRFETISKESDLKALEYAFSVEPLTKEFYQKLSAWYERAKTQVKFPNDERVEDVVHKQNSLIRLITRLLFVWFIKEKGLVNRKLFDENKIKNIIEWNKNSSYYKAILQNLFFATLNREIEDREFRKTTRGKANPTNYLAANNYRYENYFRSKSKIEIIKLFAKSPFLNGGLFACLDRDSTAEEKKEYKTEKSIRPTESAIRIDGFSDKPDNQLIIDNALFFNEDEKELGLINLLHQYQFTTEESTPADIEVALDPELLGKVFENLLASNIKETGEQARKATGSFYTPREIVGYMVDESLKQHFKQNIGLTDKELDNLFDDSNSGEVATLSDAEKEKTIAAISKLKVLDPAVGSGAFPMGILQRIVGLLEKLDPENKKWRNQQLRNSTDSIQADINTAEKIGDDEARTEAIKMLTDKEKEIKKLFSDQGAPYLRKLHLIQNSIFGVDIQPIACQIAKLRFFISLAIEQKANSDKSDNYGIKPLPNLETKFIAADTLIGLSLRKDMFTESAEIKRLKDEIQKNRAKHFNASTRKVKMNCTDVDEKLRNELAEEWKSNYKNNMEWLVASDINDANAATLKKERDRYNQKIIERKQTALIKATDQKKVQLSDKKVAQLDEEIAECEHLASLIFNKDHAAHAHAIWQKAIARVEEKMKAIAGDAKKIADWNPYDQNAKADWFDAEFMFSVSEGFDVVIGNPPYVQVKKDIYSVDVFPYSEGKDTGKQNLYKLFTEQSYNLCRKNGIATMIVQSSLMCDKSSAGIRQLLLDKTQLHKIIEFPKNAKSKEKQVFQSVTQGTCIFLFTKHSVNDYEIDISIHNDSHSISTLRFSTISKSDITALYPSDRYLPQIMVGGVSILKWIKSNKNINPMLDFVQQMEQGDINLTTCSAMFSTHNMTNTKLMRGRHVSKYCIKYAMSDECIDNNFMADRIKINVDNCFLISQQITGTNDVRRLHFALHNNEDEQVLWGNSVNKTLLIDQGNSKYFLALLNSKFMDWYFRITSTNNHVQIYELKQLPILISQNQQPFITIIDKILAAKSTNPNADTNALENQIDNLVYKLYDLSESEINLIKS